METCFTPIEELLWEEFRKQLSYKITPQAQIGRYRVDFLIDVNSGISGLKHATDNVVVECDGHEFHEKTQAQAIRDKTRDRELQRLGYSVIRFSGSEIWKDAKKCADFVNHFISDLVMREWRKTW